MRPRPIRNSQSTLPTDSSAHPVGLATELPRPPALHAEVKSFHQTRGLAGSGSSSPTAGTRVSIRVRLARRMPMTTTIQTIVVPIELSRQRRTVTWAPT